jgi:predicted RNA-binding Zn-ribbon protein involved in translation (DUF1610 family)
MTSNEFLLYPLGDPTDVPACARCGEAMPLARLEAAPGRPDYSTFRCPACGRSETFIADDAGGPAI